jgi:ribonuclease E
MFRRSALAALLLAAAPAFAQNQTAPAPSAPAGPPPEAMAAIQTAAGAFGQCVQAGVQAVPATVTPEAGATNVLAGCATQKQTLEQAVRALLAQLPAEQRTAGEAQLNAQLAAVPGQVADGIRQSRAAPAPVATPAPAPAQ